MTDSRLAGAAPPGTPIRGGDLIWLGATLGGFLWAVAVATGQNLPVLLPLVAVVVSAIAFYLVLARTSGSATPYLEIGGVYVAVASLYAIWPLVAFIAIGRWKDGRVDNATPVEIGWLGWYYVGHLAAFAATYLLVRGRAPALAPRWRRPDPATWLAAGLLYAAISAYFGFVYWGFDLSPSTYAETYAMWRRVPLEVAQLANHLGGGRFVLELVLLSALFARYERWRWAIAVWLALTLAAAFVRLGSRTELMVLTVAVILMYHYLVRPVRLRHALAGGGAALGAFVLQGIIRNRQDLLANVSIYGVSSLFASDSDFEVVFTNAYHTSRMLAAGILTEIPLAVQLSDLLALVPQQLAPIAKTNPADWYVWTFYPHGAAQGHGFVFGTIAEAVIGGGWVDAVGRGAALGLAFAGFHRAVVRRPSSFWAFILYVWMTVQVYHCIRSSTFILLGYFVYRVVPAVAAVAVLAVVLREAIRRSPLPRRGRAEVAV